MLYSVFIYNVTSQVYYNIKCQKRQDLIFLTPLHVGYLVHPQNAPYGPLRNFIGAPQTGHFTPVEAGSTLASLMESSKLL